MQSVALLRGINVGGNKLVPMADLRAMLEGLGYSEVRTLLQSGNAVFEAPESGCDPFENQIETVIRARFGFEVEVMVRTPSDWTNVLSANPFPSAAEEEPGRLLVVFLKSKPEPGAFESLAAAHPGPEKMVLAGRELYVHYVDGIGVSKLNPNQIERKLGVRGTGRNWNTVLKIAALLD